MEEIRQIVRPTAIPDQGLLCDLLWADPDKEINEWSKHCKSYTFGHKIVRQFLAKHDLDLICCSNQVIESGYN